MLFTPSHSLPREGSLAAVPFSADGLRTGGEDLVSCFDTQALLTPAGLAVKSLNREYTYAELKQASDVVARHVVSRGGKPHSRVAVMLDQGVNLLAAIIGVLKAGRICVPIEPDCPDERCASILVESSAEVLVTDTWHLQRARAFSGGTIDVIPIDSIDGPATAFHAPPGDADLPSFIFYTSGSTGHPKGVIQTHRMQLHMISVLARSLGLNQEDRLPMFSSCGSGLGALTALAALLTGASIHFYDLREEGIDRLADWLNEERITIFMSAATIFRDFTGSLKGNERFENIRAIRLGSEPVTARDFEMYHRYFEDGCVFINALASTETGIIAQNILDKKSEVKTRIVPAGYAVEGASILIIDESGRRLGFDQPGEIVVRGEYLSPGYWQRPDLTAGVFLQAGQGNQRLYRTGDVGILRRDGCLEYLGRRDFQVKIRGNRVEPEEIEAAINSHPEVRMAAVDTRIDGEGERSISAFVVPAEGSRLTPAELRHYLRQRLQEFMVPASVVFLGGLPLTPNGKVDRAALRTLGATRKPDAAARAPQNEIEHSLLKAWREVFSNESIGVDDDFFELGGHSLLAVQLTYRMRELLDVELPLQILYSAPTVAAIAGLVETNRQISKFDSSEWRYLVPLQEQGWKTPFFLVPGGEGGEIELFLYAKLARHLSDRRPVFGLRTHGFFDSTLPHGDVGSLAAAFISEIRRLQPRGPYLIGGECVGGILAYEIAQQLISQGEVVSVLALLDTLHPGRFRYQLRRAGKIARLFGELFKSLWNDLSASAGAIFRGDNSAGEGLKFFFNRSWLKVRLTLWQAARLLELRRSSASQQGSSRSASSPVPEDYGLILWRYRPIRYQGRITHFVSTGSRSAGSIRAWARLAAGGLDTHIVPGDHETYLRVHAEAVAAELRKCLDEAN